MAKQPYTVVTFHTTAEAMAMKKAAVEYRLQGRLAPIPRRLSAGCGFAWLEPGEHSPLLERLLASGAIEHEAKTGLLL